MERRKQYRERRRNVAIGLTAVASVVGLGLLLFSFGYLPGFLNKGYAVTMELDNAAGLHEASRVTLAGYDVGTVEHVALVASGDAPTRAQVRMRILDEVDIPENVSIRIETPLFGGGPTIALMPAGPATAYLPKDGTGRLPGERVEHALVRIEIISDDLRALRQQWVPLAEHVNAMFDDDPAADGPNLPRILSGVEDRLEQLERVLEGAERWTGNEQLLEDLTQAATNLRALSETLDERIGALEERYLGLADEASAVLEQASGLTGRAGEALDGVEAAVQTLEQRLVALADDATATMATVDALVQQAGSEDGTLGLLLNDPSLYQNLDDSAERLQLLIEDARLLIAKWKAEGLPLNVFD